MYKRISFLKSSNSPLKQKVSGALAESGRGKAINRGSGGGEALRQYIALLTQNTWREKGCKAVPESQESKQGHGLFSFTLGCLKEKLPRKQERGPSLLGEAATVMIELGWRHTAVNHSKAECFL